METDMQPSLEAAFRLIEVERPAVIQKVGWRLMPYVFAMFFVSIIDRGNLGFAALSMNRELHLNGQMFGIGVGVFFLAFALFQVPSNLAFARFGARATLSSIAILWGLATMLMAFVQGPLSFYATRALLGAAEAGIAPGLLLYLSYWFPAAYRARNNAIFTYSAPAAYVVTSIISGWIIELGGTWGLPGWKWLFLIEGLPAIALGLAGLYFVTNRPLEAAWLAPDDRQWLQRTLDAEAPLAAAVPRARLGQILTNPLVWLLALTNTGVFAGLATLSTWLPQIVHGFGLPHQYLGPLVAVPPLAGAVGMFFFSRHSDRHQERIGHVVAALLLAAAGYALVVAVASPVLIIVGFMLANIGVYSSMAVMWTLPQTYLPRNITAAGIGMISTGGSIAGFAVTTLLGRVQDMTHSLTTGFSIVIVVFLVACGAVLLFGRALRASTRTA